MEPTGESEEDAEKFDEPFSLDNAPLMNFIMQGRIYDVLMAILAETSETGKKMSQELLEIHAAGAFMGPAPAFSGNFLTDELNAQEDIT